jgi:hypothetical protein
MSSSTVEVHLVDQSWKFIILIATAEVTIPI